MNLDESRAAIGQPVLYQKVGVNDRGVIRSTNDKYVFVLYEGAEWTAATYPEDLVLLRDRCPDAGMCHHKCDDGACFRVQCCGPLSGVFPGDEWPDEVKAANQP